MKTKRFAQNTLALVAAAFFALLLLLVLVSPAMATNDVCCKKNEDSTLPKIAPLPQRSCISDGDIALVSKTGDVARESYPDAVEELVQVNSKFWERHPELYGLKDLGAAQRRAYIRDKMVVLAPLYLAHLQESSRVNKDFVVVKIRFLWVTAKGTPVESLGEGFPRADINGELVAEAVGKNSIVFRWLVPCTNATALAGNAHIHELAVWSPTVE